MLVQIDENSATLTPFGCLARHIPLGANYSAQCFLRQDKNARTKFPPSRKASAPIKNARLLGRTAR